MIINCICIDSWFFDKSEYSEASSFTYQCRSIVRLISWFLYLVKTGIFTWIRLQITSKHIRLRNMKPQLLWRAHSGTRHRQVLQVTWHTRYRHPISNYPHKNWHLIQLVHRMNEMCRIILFHIIRIFMFHCFRICEMQLLVLAFVSVFLKIVELCVIERNADIANRKRIGWWYSR